MCGRYQINLDGDDKYTKQLIKRIEELNLKDFNMGEIYPTNNCLILKSKEDNKVELDIKKWGIPLKTLLINARMENIKEKNIYKNMHRCVVIASGFYEWKDKNKYYISKEDPFIYLGALYNQNNEFVIITGESKEKMMDIHHRSPVIFDNKEMLDYLHQRKDVYINNHDLIINQVIV